MNKEYQEALNKIKEMHCNIINCDCEKCNMTPFCAYYECCKILQEAIEKANKYDEKETPKKPIKRTLIEPYDYDEQGVNKNKILQCPSCKFKLYDEYECIDYTFDYCPRCGQKLDFGR